MLPELYEKLKGEGWEEKTWESGDTYLVKDEFEIVSNWDYENYHPNPKQIIGEAEVIDGVPIVRLQEVLAWKKAFSREKDLKDIELIEKYFSHKK